MATSRCAGTRPSSTPLRIAVIASARYPIRQPFAGGLEAHTWQLAHRLGVRGHRVHVYAGADSDPGLDVRVLRALPALSRAARQDISMPAEYFLAEHHAYLSLMLSLAAGHDYDVVHNNSLHYLPIAMASSLTAPLLTTLHTPPTPWLESALGIEPGTCAHFAAVSQHTADEWRGSVPVSTVIRNGVDLDRWRPGPGGGPPVWSGRVVPEKGPEEAIRAARLAGTGLRLAGPCPDPTYFRERVRPLLGDGVEYVGHLDHAALAELVGSASVAVVSPCWDEPYGLVVAEALACGTPVAGFARGALPELLDKATGALAAPGDMPGLAGAITTAAGLDRGAARRRAEATCSVEAMVDGYERLYRELVRGD
ncbi:glycosyltransferase [Actinokineospora sp. PR83]|uniref:glycosyltransferase n=1 Tax=Actinokineospora sp. PR83 TaxID=2884908 RepID=UPI001F48DFF2|nr:glycosyltransferase [Actinokineospora sp. PR83]MCG8915854.1 glycosyltransferase [Actinokineospora sp. PR83]